MSDSATPWIAVLQPPLSVAFSRQEYWIQLLLPLTGDLPNPGTEPESPGFFTSATWEAPKYMIKYIKYIITFSLLSYDNKRPS